jgi:hypothetical protein
MVHWQEKQKGEVTANSIHIHHILLSFVNCFLATQLQWCSEASSNVPLGCTELPIAGQLLKYQEQVQLGTPTVKQTNNLSILSNESIEVGTSDALMKNTQKCLLQNPPLRLKVTKHKSTKPG